MVSETPIGRSHIGRQLVFQIRTKTGTIQQAVCSFYMSHQLFCIAYLTNFSNTLLYIRVGEKCALDISQLNAIAAQLYLKILSSHEVQQAICFSAYQIACGVKTRIDAPLLITLAYERIVDKALAVKFRTVMIAISQLQTTKIQLTNNTIRQEIVIIVEHIAGYPRQRFSDAVRIPCCVFSVGMAGAAYCTLCRAIAIDEGDVTVATDNLLTWRFTSNEYCLQRCCRVFMAGMQECWRNAGPSDLFLFHKLEQLFSIFLHCFRSRYQCSPAQQGAEDVDDGCIEEVCRELDDAVICSRTIDVWSTYRYHRYDATMWHDDTLRFSCCARRVNHVGRGGKLTIDS